MKKLDIVRFAAKGDRSFFDAVTASINNYFESNNISKYANPAMWTKGATMLAIYFIPYVIIVTGLAGGLPMLYFGMWFLMGWGMSGIGTSIMHDANHGSFSKNKSINNFISQVLGIVGGYNPTWRIQHNILHHTYTNIAGLDEDIDNKFILRFSPEQPLRWYHKYQFIYAWLFYTLTTLFWVTAKDYVQAARYNKYNLLKKEKVSLPQAFLRITLIKIFYFTYCLVIPILYSGMPVYVVLLGFLLMHVTAGLLLTCFFQLAHVNQESKFLPPTGQAGERKMMDSWAVHEVENTTNFSIKSRFITWFSGGLNFQIEHHLFSHICHIHYPRLSPIVKRVVELYGLTYSVQPSILHAIRSHTRMLSDLGYRKSGSH